MKMEATTDLTITVKVDTRAARQEVEDFRRYAMQTLDEIRRALDAAQGQSEGPSGGTKRRA